jgi:hypothetical protein
MVVRVRDGEEVLRCVEEEVARSIIAFLRSHDDSSTPPSLSTADTTPEVIVAAAGGNGEKEP